MSENIDLDAVALARRFVSGLSLKRAELNQMIRELLAIVDEPRAPVAPVWAQPSPAAPPGTLEVTWGLPDVPGYDKPSPVQVQPCTAGAIFLGPESNRYYTRLEAVALAGAIARAAAR